MPQLKDSRAFSQKCRGQSPLPGVLCGFPGELKPLWLIMETQSQGQNLRKTTPLNRKQVRGTGQMAMTIRCSENARPRDKTLPEAKSAMKCDQANHPATEKELNTRLSEFYPRYAEPIEHPGSISCESYKNKLKMKIICSCKETEKSVWKIQHLFRMQN